MSRLSVLGRFRQLDSWQRGDEEAPHKPLLMLYALGRWYNSRIARVPFHEVDRDLTTLLKEFGPVRESYHPEYPFWRLQNDGVWEVHATTEMEPRASNTDPKKSELLRHDATGGFPDSVLAVLCADPELVFDIAQCVLDARFPAAQHAAILGRVGLDRD